MTDTLSRPLRTTGAGPSARHPAEAGVTGAVWAVCAGLVATALPVLLVWATDGRSGSGAGAALRTAGQVWLVAHGAGLQIPGGMFELSPLGLLLLPVALLVRAGGHGARACRVAGLRDAAVLTGWLAGPYALLCAVVAALSATGAVRPVAWQALLAGLVVGITGGAAGVLRGAGLGQALLAALPIRAARLLIATTAALAVLAAGGALIAGASFWLHLGRARDLASAAGAGAVGGVALLVLGLTLVPNAAIWGVAWLAGPGFCVGAGTAVGPFGTTLGPVPALPLLAALPGPVPAWAGLLAMLVPVGAGVLAGLLIVRRLPTAGWRTCCWEAALVGPCAGLAAGAAGWLSAGAVGGGRLAELGPSGWQFGLAVAAEVGVAAAASAAGVRRRVRP